MQLFEHVNVAVACFPRRGFGRNVLAQMIQADGSPLRAKLALAVNASSSVSPATNRRAKPYFMPRRAIELVMLGFVDSHKMKLRINIDIEL